LPLAFAQLNLRLGLPQRLRELGIAASALPGIAAAALEDNAHKTNPRPLAREDYAALLEAAY
jgi:4-hydroxybutyrate dehydrogenase